MKEMERIMFRKLIKNTFIGLMLLSYAATAISMEQPNNTVANSQTQISSAEENLQNWDAAEAKRHDEKAEEADVKDSWASLSWWTKGLNAITITLRTYFLYKHLNQPNSYAQNGFIPIGQFIQSGEHPVIAQTLQSVQKAMPISADTYIDIDRNLPMPAAAGHKIICINPYLLMLFNQKEKESIVGHETRHIYHKDVIMEDLMVIASPFIAWGALKLYSKGMRYLLTSLQNKVDRNSKTYRYIRTVKTVNTAISHNVITHQVLELLLSNKFRTFYELRADRESALLLNNIEDVIGSFKKMQDPSFKSAFARIAGCTVEDLVKNEAMSYYPFAMRIKALETLQQQFIKK